MKTLILILALLLSVQAQSIESRLNVKYDKFEDQTGVALWRLPLARGTIDWIPEPMSRVTELRLTLVHVYQGNKPRTPMRDEQKVLLTLSADDSLGSVIGGPQLIFLIDGERFKLDTEWAYSFREEDKTKEAQVHTPYGLVVRLATAKSVEGRLGSVEFHLVPWQQEEIQKFLKAINP